MRVYGETADGIGIEEYALTNANGVEIKIITYGGIVTSIRVPDRRGNFANVALGFDSLAKYEAGHPYFGAITGRYANRIAGGRFSLDGVEYQLFRNDGNNALHGGEVGFDKRVWQARAVSDDAGEAVELSYRSPGGEEEYPGNGLM